MSVDGTQIPQLPEGPQPPKELQPPLEPLIPTEPGVPPKTPLPESSAPPPGFPPQEAVPPAPPRSRWYRFLHWEHLGLLVIVLVTLGFHFAAIMRPLLPIWDEGWYVGDARSIVSRTGELRPEHPPLGKLFIVAGEYIFNGFTVPERVTGATTIQPVGSNKASDTVIAVTDATRFKLDTTIRINSEQMKVTGIDTGRNEITVERETGGTTVSSHAGLETIYVYTDNAFGWRFFSIVFGTIGIVVVYFICRRLKLPRNATLIATFLFALEDMTFLHSGLALLDVFMVTFMLGAVLAYLRRNYLLMGVLVALSAECKLAGVLILIAIVLHWAIYRRDRLPWFAGSLVLAALSFVFFIVFFDFFIKGSIENPLTRIQSLVSGTAANTFTIPKLSISSRPWTWIYPQWYQLYYNSPNVPFIVYSYDPQYISFISSTVQILIVPTIAFMIYKAIRGIEAAAFVWFWFLATYLVWLPLDAVTNRVTFVFYFLPTAPAICIGLGIAISTVLNRLGRWRANRGRTTNWIRALYAVVGLYLLVHLAIFVIFNPAVPTFIKTWLPPLEIGVDTNRQSSQQSSKDIHLQISRFS